MYQFQRAQKKTLPISLLLIVFSLFLTLPFDVYSQGLGGNTNFQAFVLFGDQTVSATATHDQILSVGVLSIGNITLTAELQFPQTEAGGAWWLILISPGGSPEIDVDFGFFPASSSVSLFVNPGFSVGLAIGGIILNSPETLEEPVEYGIRVSGGSAS